MATARKTPTAASRKAPARKSAAPAAKAAKTATVAKKSARAPKTTKIPASVKSVDKPVEARADKPRKAKLVRDSFTIPKAEYTVLEELKVRAGRLGRPTKKSEVLRAGVIALAAMADQAFLAGIDAVPALKTGRPAKD